MEVLSSRRDARDVLQRTTAAADDATPACNPTGSKSTSLPARLRTPVSPTRCSGKLLQLHRCNVGWHVRVYKVPNTSTALVSDVLVRGQFGCECVRLLPGRHRLRTSHCSPRSDRLRRSRPPRLHLLRKSTSDAPRDASSAAIRSSMPQSTRSNEPGRDMLQHPRNGKTYVSVGRNTRSTPL
jgi:hypothetical protein